jgi:hypothetical protein
MSKNGKVRVYRPQRTFDDDLVDLAGFFVANGLGFDGVDGARLQTVGAEQRDDRAEEGRLLGAHRAHHEAFIRNQAARHGLYMQALAYARAKFRTDSAKIAELSRYRRHIVRNGTPAPDDATPKAAGPS